MKCTRTLPSFCIQLLIIGLFPLLSCQSDGDQQQASATQDITTPDEEQDWRKEIIYHVMQRSFYDADGDRHGDLNGFVQKLDYLQELGVTTILFTPLYESGFYHNYFPTDYEKIDPEYGTMEEYIAFVKAVHQKGMKFLMDMETQYAQGEHPWFADSYKNPDSEYADFIYYSDSLNEYPEQIFMPSRSPLHDFKAWPGDTHHIVFLDLNHEQVKQWMKNFYAFWVDPNQDGNFEDGVDGFRIDHIMDDLDHKGLFTNMYQGFWKPIFDTCRTINPGLFVLGEQSNWNEYGETMIVESGANAAFNFQLRFALAGEEGVADMYKNPDPMGVKIDPERVHRVLDTIQQRYPAGTYWVNFLENHDTFRWASVVKGNEGQKRIGAILTVLLPGIPSIYYGQELGVPGKVQEWGSDANHIPVREAFPWTANPDDEGTAAFYKDTGAWWDSSYFHMEEMKTMALDAQQKNPKSLWKLYQELIQLRKTQAAFMQGGYQPIVTEAKGLFAFARTLDKDTCLVIVNLKDEKMPVSATLLEGYSDTPLAGKLLKTSEAVALAPYHYVVLSVD